MRARAAVSGIAFALIASLVTGASATTASTRLYLLGSGSGYLYWSPDANDPEAQRADVSRSCGVPPVYGTPASEPCLAGPQNGFIYTLFFMPGALLEQPLTWTESTRPVFHVELEGPPIPYTVHFVVQAGVDQVESPAATQTVPGVFEGTIPSGVTLDPNEGNLLGVRIRTASPRFPFTLRTGGRSYVDLQEPTSIVSVPQLLARSSYVPAPSRYETPQRSFDFNDEEWTVIEHTGDLSQPRRFPISLAQRASVVFAWVEAFDRPALYEAGHGRPPSTRSLTDAPVMRFLREGVEIERGANWTTMHGRGMEAVSLVGVEPGGSLEVEVIPANGSSAESYALRVLVTNTDRTIAGMRWRFTHAEDEPFVVHRSVTSGYCPAASEPIPVTTEATTYSLELDWDTANAMQERWTPRYSLPGVGSFPCGEGGTGDRMRFTIPGARVAYIGAVPARDAMFVTDRMTIFEADVRFAYTPA